MVSLHNGPVIELKRSSPGRLSLLETGAFLKRRITMPCGGIYPIDGGPGTLDQKLSPTEGGCWMCHRGGCKHFCDEWDTYIHARCVPKFLHTAEGEIVIDHGHQVLLHFDLEVKKRVLRKPRLSDLHKPIAILKLPCRAHNALKNNNVETVAQAIRIPKRQLLMTRNCGRKSLSDIENSLAELGFEMTSKERE